MGGGTNGEGFLGFASSIVLKNGACSHHTPINQAPGGRDAAVQPDLGSACLVGTLSTIHAACDATVASAVERRREQVRVNTPPPTPTPPPPPIMFSVRHCQPPCIFEQQHFLVMQRLHQASICSPVQPLSAGSCEYWSCRQVPRLHPRPLACGRACQHVHDLSGKACHTVACTIEG